LKLSYILISKTTVWCSGSAIWRGRERTISRNTKHELYIMWLSFI